MSYNRFQYWVRGPRHKKLGVKYSIQMQIENGDFEYPNDVKDDLSKQRESLEKRTKEYWVTSKSRGITDESIRENIDQVFKKARVSIMKVQEELVQEELVRLNEFKQAAFRSNYPFLDSDVKQMIWETLLENCLGMSEGGDNIDNKINNTSDFYKEYNRRIEKYGMEDNLNKIKNVLDTTVEKDVA
jgi:hypothetical protein